MALKLSKHEPFSLDQIFTTRKMLEIVHTFIKLSLLQEKLDEAGVIGSVKSWTTWDASLHDQGRTALRLPLGLMAAPKNRWSDPLLLRHYRQARNCALRPMTCPPGRK